MTDWLTELFGHGLGGWKFKIKGMTGLATPEGFEGQAVSGPSPLFGGGCLLPVLSCCLPLCVCVLKVSFFLKGPSTEPG